MGIMTNRNACRAKLILFLVAFVGLAAFQPGFAEAQDIEEIRQAAEQGDARAQFLLGSMYMNGEGVPKHFREAAKWYRQAADQGHASAQLNLGYMYDKGEGVPEDDPEAVKWYRKAAEQGDTSAQSSLGIMYGLGEGVPEDYVKAYVWVNLAAAQGEESAVNFKTWLRSRMTVEQVAEAQRLSGELYSHIESSKSE